MAITLGTNIPAYNTRMTLNGVSDSLTTTMERLSSGLKINRASDDAAGLVISQNMQALISSSKQAMANVQTAKSFLTIAEDGMVSISDHFQRINDLLTNMANDTNDVYSRKAAVDEIIERLSEINRLADSTNFNGMTMLSRDEESESIIIQMGADSTELSILDISTALTDCHIETFGCTLPDELNPESYKNSNGDVFVKSKFNNQYWLETVPGEEEEDPDTYRIVTKNDAGELVYATAGSGGSEEKYTGDEKDLQELKSGYIVRGETPEEDKTILSYTVGDDTKYITVGDDHEYDSDKLSNLVSNFTPNNANCRAYMAKIKSAIEEIAMNRGLLGAYENRLESSYDSMSIRIESLEAARAPYTDTDIAEEATNLTSSQIMQQINVSILSNANSMQSMALALLGG